MMRLGFDIRVQVIRVLVMSALYIYIVNYEYFYGEVKTVASRLDQEWLCEFFLLMICFFIFINCVFILAVASDAPQIIYVVLRVFGGTCVALISHINKGFSLYDELTL